MNLEPRRLVKNNGGFPCPEPECQAEPWVLETHLRDHLDVATAVKYGAALRYQLFDAAAARRELEAELAAREEETRAADLALEEKACQIRKVIVDRHLYLRCPRCAFKFDDYEGCNALSCGKVSAVGRCRCRCRFRCRYDTR